MVVDPSGRCLGYAVAGSGNPVAVGPETAAAAVAESVAAALGGAAGEHRIRLVVLAMAGAGSASVTAELRQRLTGIGSTRRWSSSPTCWRRTARAPTSRTGTPSSPGPARARSGWRTDARSPSRTASAGCWATRAPASGSGIASSGRPGRPRRPRPIHGAHAAGARAARGPPRRRILGPGADPGAGEGVVRRPPRPAGRLRRTGVRGRRRRDLRGHPRRRGRGTRADPRRRPVSRCLGSGRARRRHPGARPSGRREGRRRVWRGGGPRRGRRSRRCRRPRPPPRRAHVDEAVFRAGDDLARRLPLRSRHGQSGGALRRRCSRAAVLCFGAPGRIRTFAPASGGRCSIP